MKSLKWVLILSMLVGLPCDVRTEDVPSAARAWPQTMAAARVELSPMAKEERAARLKERLAELRRRFPVETDWLCQDEWRRFVSWLEGEGEADFLRETIERVLPEAPAEAQEDLRDALEGLASAKVAGGAEDWLALYRRACAARRVERLRPLLAKWRWIAFVKHFNMGGSHYAYTEAQSDAQSERSFRPGAALCVLDLVTGDVETLLADEDGVIRDPDVSFDGERILFAWKQSDREDDYHLYEMDSATREVRQLTDGLGFADYEGIYLPNGDILFNSTRCVQTVDCWWTEVSNLYTCDGDGKYLRRVSFDQVHTNYPQLLDDGRVVYTRWDYNDRGQIYPQPLFQMNPDGTAQTEFYGNNSWFPTTIAHARGIPGTTQVVAILTGHHSHQTGKLATIDPALGRQENEGVRLIAPERETRADRVDAYGQWGEQFQYPYALSDEWFLVGYSPDGANRRRGRAGYDIAFVSRDGRRELLVSDPDISCSQPVPLAPRPRPHQRPSRVDYARTTGAYYVQDVYVGPGLAGVKRGTIRGLRVVGLEFRAAGVGNNGNWGPSGGALVSTPIAAGNGTWDVKRVLGTARVYEDGSAFFAAPARTPIYFQALDADGRAVQTMRSWSTLQPGETFSCVGCHESKKDAPPALKAATLAGAAGPQPLEPFYGPARGFSFPKEIQPILDRHCVSCHNDREERSVRSVRTLYAEADRLRPGRALLDQGSEWRYRVDPPGEGWERPAFDDAAWAQGRGGFGEQPLSYTRGLRTAWASDALYLRATFTIPADKSGRRIGFVSNHVGRVSIFVNGVAAAEASGHIAAYQVLRATDQAAGTLREGENRIAVRVEHATGARFFDLAVVDAGPAVESARPVRHERAFSLLGETRVDNQAKRRWSDSYLALTNARGEHGAQARPTDLVNFVTAQTAPDMLPPYATGSAVSGLPRMLAGGHGGVALSREEMEKIACWIDLGVPYCGDYVEANTWSAAEQEKYERYAAKRRRMEAIEQENIRALLGAASE